VNSAPKEARQTDSQTWRVFCYGLGVGGHKDLHSTASATTATATATATLDRQRQCGDAAAKRAARAVFVCQVSRGWIGGLVDLWIVLGGSSSLVVGVRSCQCWAVSSCVVPARLALAARCLPAFKSCSLSLPPSPPSSTSSARGAV
jgi:hypothetical protein